MDFPLGWLCFAYNQNNVEFQHNIIFQVVTWYFIISHLALETHVENASQIILLEEEFYNSSKQNLPKMVLVIYLFILRVLDIWYDLLKHF